MAEELCASLAAHGRSGRTIGIKVRLDDWTTVTRARTLAEPTCDAELVSARRAAAAARVRAAAAGAPARRARRRPGRHRGARRMPRSRTARTAVCPMARTAPQAMAPTVAQAMARTALAVAENRRTSWRCRYRIGSMTEIQP